MSRLVVVGIGADGVEGLTPAAAAALRSARVVHGSVRQLALLDASITAQRRPWPSPMAPVLPTLLDGAYSDVHVVASGDPMLHGVGATLVRLFGADRVTVLPHVSSVTLACARLGWPVQDVEVISLVTASPQSAVRRGGRAVVLSRDAATPADVASLLVAAGRGSSELSVLEQLGAPAERVRTATAQVWAADPPRDVDPLNVLAVHYLPDDRRFGSWPDDAFEHDGQLTKQSMRAVTVTALGPRPDEVLWDVGAGSGSIAVEWCLNGRGCRAVAFERDAARRQRIAANALAFGVPVAVRGEAPDDFGDVPAPAVIFIGGGLIRPGLVQACWDRLEVGGRLVANVVTAESEAEMAQWYSRLGGELRRFQHYRGEPVGGFTGFRPAMPVTQWAVSKR